MRFLHIIDHVLGVIFAVYFFVVAVIFAGMVLTPTEGSREADKDIHDKHIHCMSDRFVLLNIKLYISLICPILYVEHLWKDRGK
jgi:hypothetical protein